MTTTLRVLEDKLQVAIGDERGTYANKYVYAIQNAIREIYPKLHRPVIDTSLITGNILPPFNWSTTALLDLYTEPTGTLLKNTSSVYYHNGPTSARITATGADDGIILDSQYFPRLLDLMDNTVSLKCWVISQDNNDAFLDIITTSSAGVDTTKSSTTTCVAGVRTLLEIEDYAIPDDIVRIRVKLRVHSTGRYVYFDPPRLTGKTIDEYVLPTDFQNGDILKVGVQSWGYSDDACDDLQPTFWEIAYDWSVFSDGTYRYLKLAGYGSGRRIHLTGYCPLEIPTTDIETISLEGEKVNLLIAYAAYLLYEMEMIMPSATDVSRIERASVYWYGKYQRLLQSHKMRSPNPTMRIAEW